MTIGQRLPIVERVDIVAEVENFLGKEDAGQEARQMKAVL